MKTVKLIGDIDPYKIEKVIDFVNETKEDEELEIYLHSSGGDGDSAFAIYDYIKLSKKKTKIIALGRVESAALVILAAGTIRQATPNTVFMYHLPVLLEKDNNYCKNGHKLKDVFLHNFFKISEDIGLKKEDFSKKKFCFGVERALKIGLIHSVCTEISMKLIS